METRKPIKKGEKLMWTINRVKVAVVAEADETDGVVPVQFKGTTQLASVYDVVRDDDPEANADD